MGKATPIHFRKSKRIGGRSTPSAEKVDGPGNPIDFFVKRKLKGENLSLANGTYELSGGPVMI